MLNLSQCDPISYLEVPLQGNYCSGAAVVNITLYEEVQTAAGLPSFIDRFSFYINFISKEEPNILVNIEYSVVVVVVY